MMNVLVLNTGSSSVKFQIIATDLAEIDHNADERLARGMIERVGGEAVISLQAGDAPARKTTASLADLRAAIDYILRWVISPDSAVAKINSLGDIHAVGHRVVHGGEQFQRSAVIDEAVLEGIEACIDLAPLHNPNNLKGIRAVQSLLGREIPQVAVFDTAFHHTLPERSYLYAIPYQYYRRHKIRRYGFHGTSHRYVAYRYRLLRNLERDQTRIITIHLGNGCSAAAIRDGDSIDTSMGMTPLEGLVMGTRSGDVDPAVIDFVASKEGMSAHQVENVLNKQSGLLGLSGLTHDMRELVEEYKEHNDRRAGLAIDVFCYRIRKYIGSYLAAMEGADALVFTGGIGENSAEIRGRICDGLQWMGLTLDPAANERCVRGAEGPIHTADSRLAAYVIPTNEELLIARDAVRCVRGVPCP